MRGTPPIARVSKGPGLWWGHPLAAPGARGKTLLFARCRIGRLKSGPLGPGPSDPRIPGFRLLVSQLRTSHPSGSRHRSVRLVETEPGPWHFRAPENRRCRAILSKGAVSKGALSKGVIASFLARAFARPTLCWLTGPGAARSPPLPAGILRGRSGGQSRYVARPVRGVQPHPRPGRPGLALQPKQRPGSKGVPSRST